MLLANPINVLKCEHLRLLGKDSFLTFSVYAIFACACSCAIITGLVCMIERSLAFMHVPKRVQLSEFRPHSVLMSTLPDYLAPILSHHITIQSPRIWVLRYGIGWLLEQIRSDHTTPDVDEHKVDNVGATLIVTSSDPAIRI